MPISVKALVMVVTVGELSFLGVCGFISKSFHRYFLKIEKQWKPMFISESLGRMMGASFQITYENVKWVLLRSIKINMEILIQVG